MPACLVYSLNKVRRHYDRPYVLHGSNIYDAISILGTDHGPPTTAAMIQTFGGRVGEGQHDPPLPSPGVLC